MLITQGALQEAGLRLKKKIHEFEKAVYKMDNQPLISLSSIQVHESDRKNLHDQGAFLCLFAEKDIQTTFGNVRVSMQGTEGKPAIVTFHDIAQNHTSAFLGFFNFLEMQPLLEHFCIYHIDAPGQQDKDTQLPENYVYPTMDELASQVVSEVVHQMGIKTFIGFGIGAGANVLCRYGLLYPNVVDALVLVNLDVGKSGWVEWGYQKICVRQLQNKGWSTFVEDYLLWHHFGEQSKEENMDLSLAYKESLQSLLNPSNLALFINSYITRTNIDMVRPDGSEKSNKKTLTCPTLLVTGDSSPHNEEVVESNSRLDPKISEYFKVSDCGGMPLEEQSPKVAQALLLFLQGNGYAMKLRTSSIRSKSSPVRSRSTSSQSSRSTSDQSSTDSPTKRAPSEAVVC